MSAGAKIGKHPHPPQIVDYYCMTNKLGRVTISADRPACNLEAIELAAENLTEIIKSELPLGKLRSRMLMHVELALDCVRDKFSTDCTADRIAVSNAEHATQ